MNIPTTGWICLKCGQIHSFWFGIDKPSEFDKKRKCQCGWERPEK